MQDETPYASLSPDAVLAALESVGLVPDGRVLALNSYENRVYQVGMEEGSPLVVKFYRPGRWSDSAINEEHEFAQGLAARDIPVVAPKIFAGTALHRHEQFRFALFERRGGRWPELGSADEREWMGRFLARLHLVGAAGRFNARPALSVSSLGRGARDEILRGAWLPDYLHAKYENVTDEILAIVEARAADWGGARRLRIHGDCHRGNVLWSDAGPHFVDLDDCTTGPAIQDLWMLLSGSPAQMRAEMRDLLQGYEQFSPFDRAELSLIEPLRSLRMIHYAAWIARRWHDPAFPKAFPWFAEPRYWEDHHRALEEQLTLLDAPDLSV